MVLCVQSRAMLASSVKFGLRVVLSGRRGLLYRSDVLFSVGERASANVGSVGNAGIAKEEKWAELNTLPRQRPITEGQRRSLDLKVDTDSHFT